MAAYRSALEVYTKEQLPQYWATTQNNLALALTQFAEFSTDENRRELLKEAAKVHENLIAASEEGVLERSFASSFLGNLSFLKLQLADGAGALAAAKEGLKADPSQIWIKSNLLTAYLLLDDWERAEALLTENAGVILDGNKPFWQVMLDDFEELQIFGVNHPNLQRMRQHIETHYKSEKQLAAPAGQNN